MTKEPTLIVIDRNTGMSMYWEHVPMRVREIIERTRENWAGVGPPPTDFYVERKGEGIRTKHEVTFDLRPPTLRSRLAWRLRWFAQKFEQLASYVARKVK